jgi:hypothetical protein
MRRIPKMRLILLLPALLAALIFVSTAAPLVAQDDSKDIPLGDIARNLRKKTPPSQQVIDDDNLSTVMAQAQNRRTAGSALRFLMGAGDKGFQVAAPDVTCSLSFTANAKSLLSNQYAQMDLPAADVLKLEGPATIEGDALTVSLFNGTDWHVSEVAVALTIVKKTGDASLWYESPAFVPATADNPTESSQVHPERKSDVTTIYRMRAAAPPFSTTVFTAPLNEDMAPDVEWHWAIVQVKGYPPQSYSANAIPTAPQTDHPTATDSHTPPSAASPSLSTVLPQEPQ